MSKTGSSPTRADRISLAQGRGARLIECAVGIDDDAVPPGTGGADQAAPDLEGDQLRVALQPVAPTAAAPGDEVQHVTRPDRHVVALAGQHLVAAVGPIQPLVPRVPGSPPLTPHG